MTALEAVAVVFGLACVYLTIRQNILCWPVGLVQVLLYIVIFYQVKLYSDVLLHVVYVGLQVYGWHHWAKGGPGAGALPVTRLSFPVLLGIAMLIAASTAGLGFLMATRTDAALPYPDAFTTVTSLAAQWLLARKKLEAWFLWITVDVVSIGIYTTKDLHLTAGLYFLFLIMATAGFFAWKRSMDLSDGEK